MKRWHVGIATAGVVAVMAAGAVGMSGREPEVAAVSFEEATLRVRIDISERRLYVEEGGKEIGRYGVAVGTAKHPTPRGSFSMRRVIWNPRWVPPEAEWAKDKKAREAGDPQNPMGRVKVFFKEPDYYIHGTNDPASIGKAASHGCVRMRNEDIIALSKLLIEHGGAQVEPGLIQRLINRARQTHEIRLSQAIPLRVQT